MKALLWIALAVGAFASLFFLVNRAALLFTEPCTLYEDPQGCFSILIPRGVQLIERDQLCTHWELSDSSVEVYSVVADGTSLEEGIEAALGEIGQDGRRLIRSGWGSLGSWTVAQYTDSGGLGVTLAAQVRGQRCYVLLACGDQATLSAAPPMTLIRMFESFRFTEAAGKPWRPASFEQFEAFVDKDAADTGGSISIAVVQGDEITYRYVTGYADPLDRVPADAMTAYQWLSITKLITATAVMQLAESGQVNLDDPISRFVPEYGQLPVTVRQLLSHSSGLPDRDVLHLIELPGESCLDMLEISKAYAGTIGTLRFVPGTHCSYNNYDYLILGRLVEEVSGVDYETYIATHILGPLGMSNTGFRCAGDLLEHTAYPVLPRAETDEFVGLLAEKSPCGDPVRLMRGSDDEWTELERFEIVAPWGGLMGSPADAAKFMLAELHGGTWDGSTILKAESVRAMQRMQHTAAGDPLGFGLGWVVPEAESEPVVEHAGAASMGESMLRLYPNRDLGIIVMGNMSGYHSGPLVTYLAELLSE